MIQSRVERPAGRTKYPVLALLLAALLSASLMLTPKPAHAADLTVNNNVDPGDGACNSSCTLRDAILAANANTGADTIRFDILNIPGTDVKTIRPNSALPAISEQVTIDGYTQPGASPNTLAKSSNAKLMVELDGTNAGESANGLTIRADDVVVRGLAINRFSREGVFVSEGRDALSGQPFEPSRVKVEGNFIGTDATGTLDRGNGFSGVSLSPGENSTVGGTSPAARNVISGNGLEGVRITGDFNRANDNRVEGNLIGTKKDGVSALGNDGHGLIVGSLRNTVGGTTLGAANTIAFNGDDGVLIFGRFDPVLGNSIFSNAGLGIDLAGGSEDAAGHTANDPGDIDTGANSLQNCPVLTSAVTAGGSTTIKGTLNSTASSLKIATFTIQFYSNPAGTDEGKKLIGQTSVTTDSSGKASFTFKPASAVPASRTITATATRSSLGDTSEFSVSKKVVAP